VHGARGKEIVMRISHWSIGALVASTAAALLSTSTGCGKGGCVEGAYKHAASGVCLKLSPDLKADEKINGTGTTTSIRVSNSKTYGSFTIWIEPPDDLSKRASVVEKMAGDDLKLVESGDTATKGKFFHFHNDKRNYEFAVALVPGDKHFYRCEIQNTPAADAKDFLDACKTVAGP
jgi:hypothetical protein